MRVRVRVWVRASVRGKQAFKRRHFVGAPASAFVVLGLAWTVPQSGGPPTESDTPVQIIANLEAPTCPSLSLKKGFLSSGKDRDGNENEDRREGQCMHVCPACYA